LIVAWVLFPLVLIGLCVGCGLLLGELIGRPLSGLLVAPAGFAVMVVVAGILTARGETAALTTPVVVILALGGAFRTYPWMGRSPDRWALAAALGVFAVYAAPVVLSGNPTFAGYIKLDDTATWMAFVDRLMDHGRDLSGLAPSSYQTTLQVNLPSGYPVGAFLPLGIGAKLTGTDVAWLVQPYMATMAGLLALCLAWMARPLVESRRLRALVAFGAAQPALLLGYSLWGGIKEVAVAQMIALLAALAPSAAEPESGWRPIVPAAIATTALLTTVGAGAVVWALPILGLVAISLWRGRGFRALLGKAWSLVAMTLVLGVPALFAAAAFSPNQGVLTNALELGNLVKPLSVAQFAGIWPNGDFRLDPTHSALTYFLIGIAVLAAIAGAWFGWRRRARAPLIYAAGASFGSLAVFVHSSPWVGAKALASGSPAFLLLALTGAVAIAARIERVLGATVLTAILVGVFWSNALGYHDVSLAPYGQLRELESIGGEIAGKGPTLMTEYQPYGVRHFLRAGDAEAASELRARRVALVDGGELEKGEWGDTDRISLPSLLTYRTLVLRRNPAQSRPPSVYSLVRRGEFYDVWRRPAAPTASIAEHLPLGDFEDPAAVPSCAEVRRLARLVGSGGTLVGVERKPAVVASLAEATHPASWIPTEAGGPGLIPGSSGSARLEVSVPHSGRYGVYLQGSVRNRLTASVDGVAVGSVDDQLNETAQFLFFGDVRITPGANVVTLRYDGQSLAPGSGGPAEPIGPLVLNPEPKGAQSFVEVPTSEAASLCGRRLDWIEALR
jgi:hypothetical protein